VIYRPGARGAFELICCPLCAAREHAQGGYGSQRPRRFRCIAPQPHRQLGRRPSRGRSASRPPASLAHDDMGQPLDLKAPYPQQVVESASRSETKKWRFAGLFQSPLPDSNRRPLLTMETGTLGGGPEKAPFPPCFPWIYAVLSPSSTCSFTGLERPSGSQYLSQDLSPSWCRAWQRQARLHQKCRPRERCFALSERYCPRRSPSYSLRRRGRRAAERHGGGSIAVGVGEN
jgi:hypothetical protein